MNLTLRIWRQQNANAQGQFVTYQVRDVTPDMSFLEMLDALNEDLLSQGNLPLPSNTTAGRASAARAAF
jgi:succinate dehydrogenase / fumarate reductase, iron-sulfur subunit